MNKALCKIKTSTLLAVIFIVLLWIPVYAGGISIPSIVVDVNLQPDGSAIITETWEYQNIHEGTECYISMKNLGDMDISSLHVTNGNGTVFEYLEQWDASATREEKANKCALVEISDGYEIVWGFGNFGDHTFTIQYTLQGLVKEYSDYAGFNHEFITYDLTSPPEYAKVVIHANDLSFNETNSEIYSFGYEGTIYFVNNAIEAESTTNLSQRNQVTVMCRFEKGIFAPTLISSDSFDKVKDLALENADRSDAPTPFRWQIVAAIIGAFGAFFAALFALIYQLSKLVLSDGTKVRPVSMKHVDPSRNLPFDGNLKATAFALKQTRHLYQTTSGIACSMLYFTTKGYIEILEHPKKPNSSKMEAAILFKTDNPSLEDLDAQLYHSLKSAAQFDNILTASGMEKWANKNYTNLLTWQKAFEEEGKEYLLSKGYMTDCIDGKKPGRRVYFTPQGLQKAEEALGFWKYLKDYVTYQENQPIDASQWNECLLFATLFGIEHQTTEAFRHLKPDFFTESMIGREGNYPYYPNYNTMFLLGYLNSSCSRGVSHAQAAATGSGGSSSIGGGGGSSGGGGGGGVR